MRFRTLPTLGLCLALCCSSAKALVITFNAVPSSGNPILTTLATDGYTFTSSHFHTIDTTAFSFGGGPSNGTIYIAEEAGGLGGPITIAKTGGGSFSFSGVDGAKMFMDNAAAAAGGYPNADLLHIVGNKTGGGTVTADFSLTNGFISFGGLPAGFADVTSVVFSGELFTGAAGGIAIDNIVVNAGVSTPDSGVTVALLGLALLGLAAFRRRLG